MSGRDTSRLAQLSAVGALSYCSYAMCRSPVLPLFARDMGASPAAIGLVVAASTVTGVLLKFPAGAVSDVVGRRTLLLIGAAVFAMLPLGYIAIGGLVALAALRVVHGSATATFGPVVSATLSDLAPADQRGRWLSVYAGVQGAGQAIGPVLAAALIVNGDFSRVFMVSALLGSLAFAVVTQWPAPATCPPQGDMWPLLRGAARAVTSDGKVLATSLAQAGQFFVNGTLTAFLPLYAREVLGLSAWHIGWLFGLQTAATLVARPLLGTISDRVGRRPLIVLGLGTCAACIDALAWVAGFPSIAVVTTLYGAGLAATTSATSAYITDLTRRARYGAAHGLFGTIYDVGDALGPICAGLVVAAAGYAAAFHVASAVAITVAAVFAWTSRNWKTQPGSAHPEWSVS